MADFSCISDDVAKQSFEEVAARYMMETRQALETERATWRQSLYAEEQRMAAHGSQEAALERGQVEHQMMKAFRQYASEQSAQFELAARAEHQYLTNAARLEADASRRELMSAQTRFQESSMQQSLQIGSLESVLSHAEMRDRAVREDLQSFVPNTRTIHVCSRVLNNTGSSCR